MFNELMNECAKIQEARNCGLLEALSFVAQYRYEYSQEVQVQLDQFMDVGQQFFAPAN
jgi:hypothetical protein